MEPASNDEAISIAVVPMELSWIDVGSWPSLGETIEPDGRGNRISAGTAHDDLDSRNLLVFSEDSDHRICTIGCEDLVIVHTKDATLICRMTRPAVKDMAGLVPEEIGEIVEMRIVCVDLGDVGPAAAGDDVVGLVQPLKVIEERDERRRLEKVADAIAEHGRPVLVGLPINMDDTEGPRAEAAQAFGALSERCGLAVEFHDERLSSFEADESLDIGAHRKSASGRGGRGHHPPGLARRPGARDLGRPGPQPPQPYIEVGQLARRGSMPLQSVSKPSVPVATR